MSNIPDSLVKAGRSLLPGFVTLLCISLYAAPGSGDQAAVDKTQTSGSAPLRASYLDRADLPNPYAHIPAQCYIETSGGTQNACHYCHTDGLATRHFGNNTPQAGSSPVLGNLIEDYAFAALRHPFQANGSINPWENTLHPQRLRAALAATGQKPEVWDMQRYIREDNWSPAFAKRPGDPRRWDSGVEHPFRLFPGLDPADLPAGDDGFIRSNKPGNGFFKDERGWLTGWRSVNFFPYGIFTPLTGSVSGIYIRLPEPFMRDTAGDFSLEIYARNLELLAQAIQDRLPPGAPTHYAGAAAGVAIEPGLYPLGTEFAHPLHYVDTTADGHQASPSPFPGSRARRVKEIRYMYKASPWDPRLAGPETKEEDAPARVGTEEGWIDNGTGWILSGFIEDAHGALRPQTPGELVQCVGCHSGHAPQPEKGYPTFASGTGNTVDSTWALPRQLPGADGWREMDVLGYRAGSSATGAARATRAEPLNRKLGIGEYRHFLESVVGISLYGEMPGSVEKFLAGTIRRERGYSQDWPTLDLSNPQKLLDIQKLRLQLIRELTSRGEHLSADSSPVGALLYPSQSDALAGAARYRMVVATQRYDSGKDVFDETPFTFKYYRTPEQAFTHQDGRPYHQGEVITDRPIDTDPASLTWGVGNGKTLIKLQSSADPNAQYEPFLTMP